MKTRYSVYCEELGGFEVNSYELTRKDALKMARELLDERKEEVTIVKLGVPNE